MSFAKGYVKDAPHKRTQIDVAHLLGTRPYKAAPAVASLDQYVRSPCLDQNMTSSCTGHGTAQALYVAFAAIGSPLPFFPSPKDIYAITRSLERVQNPDGSYPSLRDNGAMPSDVMSAISQWGVRAMKGPSPLGFDTDCDSQNVNEEEKFGDLEADSQLMVVGEHRVDETALDFTEQVVSCIAAGVPCGIGVFVDTAFENWNPSNGAIQTVDMNDPQGGGHWIALTGYSTANGKRIFHGPNSWGPGWGAAGFWQATEDWLRAACSDCYAMSVRRYSKLGG